MQILETKEFNPVEDYEESILLVKKKIVFGDCVYADGVLVKDGEIVRLTPLETRLLKFLEGKNKRILTEEVIESVWDGKEASPQSLSYVVKGINKAVGGKFVEGVHSYGYKLNHG